MDSKAKTEIVFLRSNWFEKTQLSEGLNELVNDQLVLTQRLNEFLDVKSIWQIHSETGLNACAAALAKNPSDLVILIFLTYVDQRWLDKIPAMLQGHPVITWCYLPWNRIPHELTYDEFMRSSGSAAMFSMFGRLRQAQIPFLSTYGSLDDPKVKQDLMTYASAAQAVSSTKAAKTGILSSLTSDNLIKSITASNIRFEKIGIQEYEQAFHNVKQEEIVTYLHSLADIKPEYMVTEETMRLSASIAIALKNISAAHQLDLLVVPDHDAKIHDVAHLCPGLPPEPGDEENVIYQSILNPGAIFANLIFKQITGEASFLMQLWFWDKAKNLFVGGNSGLQSHKFATPGQIYVIGDYECNRDDPDGGAQLEFIVRPGRVTLLQLLPTPQGWQAVGTTGICLERELWVEGLPQAVVRLDPPIDDFLTNLAEIGTMQYWSMGYGSLIPEFRAFFNLMNIPFQVIEN